MPQQVLDFWFVEHGPKQWWRKDAEFDQLCRQRFLALHQQAVAGELFAWRASGTGRLAEIIVLDQLSRNMFRDSAQAFVHDAQALVLSQEAVHAGADAELSMTQRQFLYMPYMHSESKQVHAEALRLFEALGDDDALKFEQRHKAIIDRFGRYPHRNVLLGRTSSTEEQAFLREPGSSF